MRRSGDCLDRVPTKRENARLPFSPPHVSKVKIPTPLFRVIVVALLFGAIVLNYIDRQIISLLKPTLKLEFHLDDLGYAHLVNLFTISYAVMYPVGGWLADRFGTRNTLTTAIVAWSAACLGRGVTTSLRLFQAFNALLGMVEPIVFPAQLRAVTIWFPAKSRATANSFCAAGGAVGAILAAPLVAWLTVTFSWHAAFVVPGVVGLGFAAVWWLLYRDPPPEVAAEIARDAAVGTGGSRSAAIFTWPQLWRRRSLWGVLLCRFVSDPVWYYILFWLPGYLQENSGLSLAQVGVVGWIPFLVAPICGIGASIWSDHMVERGVAPLRARKIMLSTVTAIAPLCAFIPHLPNVTATLVVFCVMGGVCVSWLYSICVVMAEAFPVGNVGSVLGIAAGSGALGAVLFNTFVGHMTASLGSSVIFGVMAFLHPIAAVILWLFIKPEIPSEANAVDRREGTAT